MQEKTVTTRVKLDAYDEQTGEVFTINGISSESIKNYSIRNLNKRIAIMDLFTAQSKVCNSSKSIEIFRDILYETNKHNIFDKNITKFAKQKKHTRQQVTAMISKFLKHELAIRIDRGEYLINPLMFQAKGSTNTLIENAQFEWEEHGMTY